MNQKKLLAASVAAACLAMTTSALAADYSNHTGTADGTTLAGHLNSTSDAINSTNDTFENNKLTFTATGGLTTAAGIAASNTTVTVTDGTFTSNEVSDSDGSINGVYGTAVGVSGADGSSALTITNSTFTSNKGTSYNQTEGGAVYQSIGTATIKGSTFDQNSAGAAEEQLLMPWAVPFRCGVQQQTSKIRLSRTTQQSLIKTAPALAAHSTSAAAVGAGQRTSQPPSRIRPLKAIR